MWRWLAAYGLTALSVTMFTFLAQPYLGSFEPGYWPGGMTISWLASLVIASPTIFYYRFLIFAGERSLRRWPLAGASLMVLAGAALPPLIHDSIVAGAATGRDFAGPAPLMPDTVAVDEGRVETPDAMARGLVDCRDTCLRLLYADHPRRVVIGDAFATTRMVERSRVLAGEPMAYPTAWMLQVEHRPLCPDVYTMSEGTGGDGFPVGIRLNAMVDSRRTPSLEDRVIALMAAGNCLVARPGAYLDAAMHLGRDRAGPANLRSLQPNALGLLAGSFSHVDVREGAGWRRVSQRVEVSGTSSWIIPFAFRPSRISIFAATMNVSEPEPGEDAPQPWQWAGVAIPMPPYIGSERVRALLGAALRSPPGAPRDARFRLVRQYLAGLQGRPRDAEDRALLVRLVADFRVRVRDITMLPRVTGDEAGSIGRLLVERAGRTELGHEDIRTLAWRVTELPREAWPSILPAVRSLAADPDRAGDASMMFKLYAVGDAHDAAELLALFRRNWPPPSLEASAALSPEQRGDFNRERYARQRRLSAYLEGLCALFERNPSIGPALIQASSMDASPATSGRIVSPDLWGTMSAMGVDIERLAARRGLAADQRAVVADIAQRPRALCHPQPVRPSGDESSATAYSIPGAPTRLQLLLDAMTLFALIAGTSCAMIMIAWRRGRRQEPAPAA